MLGRVPTIVACEVGQFGSPHTRLALFLLRRDDSWRPYFEILPTDVAHFPLANGLIAANELHSSPTLPKLKKFQATIQQEWTDLLKQDPSLSQLSLETFQEARLLVSSRSFSVRVGGMSQPCLAPVVDMLNHSLCPNVAWRQFGAQIEIYCLKSIDLYEELTCSYGPKSNSALLVNYGFVIDNNPYDEFSMTLTLSISTKGYEIKKELLENQCSRTFPIPLSLKNSSLDSLLGFARFIQLQDMKQLHSVFTQAQNPEFGGFEPAQIPVISFSNELHTLSYLQETASQCLVDVAAKQAEGLIRDCQVVIEGEQRALKGFLVFLERALQVLTSAEQSSDTDSSWQFYFAQLTRFAVNGV